MKLKLAFRAYSLPLLKPLRTAHGLMPTKQGVIVQLQTGEGVRGYGEAAPLPGFNRESAEDCLALLQTVGGEIDPETAHELRSRSDCVYGAIQEAWSEVSRQLEKLSSARVAGTSNPLSSAPWQVAALLPAGKAALAEVDGRLELGFRVFKWKVGVADVADELVLLDDLLARLPSGARLRLDANGAWDRRKTERWLERCADRPIEHLEQPIAPDMREADDFLSGLAQDYPTPLALDESLVGADDVSRWLGRGWPGVYVIKPSLLGDAAEVISRLATARARVVFSSALETGVGARSALRHALAWTGERRALGFGVWPLFTDSQFDGPFQAPFLKAADVERLKPEAVWNALT
ncbi:MAG TPA: o-succinylbenzoate synthase [Opitutaceae bacterium]|nr:o-succinylbenzoate synthase [Opitutaceae bacterium]